MIVVVGGGLAGLATAWHLGRSGEEVLVLEAREPGHGGGSSHGRARMTRCTYGSALYAELVAEALDTDWPELARIAGEPLIRPVPAVFFGPRGGLFDTFREATLASGVRGLRDLPVAEARARAPALQIDDGDGALLDETAGVISADRTLVALRAACAGVGVEVRTNAPAARIEPAPGGVRVRLDGPGADVITPERVVVAAGAWTPRLLPSLATVLVPLRQVVAYAAAGEPAPEINWARLDDGLVYGLPPHAGDGAKMAGHRLTGPPDDPDAVRPVSDADRAALRETLAPALRVVPAFARTETCLYTATASEDPVLARLPQLPRVTVLAGLSGHGFKLGPLLGRIAARVCLGRPTGVSAFDRERARFGVSR